MISDIVMSPDSELDPHQVPNSNNIGALAYPPHFFPPPPVPDSNNTAAYNMCFPSYPPQFFPMPPYAPLYHAIPVWPGNPLYTESMIVSSTEYPCKKPKNLEDASSSDSTPNQVSNPTVPPPNASKLANIFFKTRLCTKFKSGTCHYGSNCNFAHGTEDLRKPPPNWQDLVASPGDDGIRNWEKDQRVINKMKLCKKFCNGEECPYGERCNFLHEEPAKFRESSTINVAVTPSSNASGAARPDDKVMSNSSVDSSLLNPKPIAWKTQICYKWETTGQCSFGDKCHFAHGLADLQKFGGHYEVDTKGSSGADLSKPLLGSANDVSLTVPSSKPETLVKRNRFLTKTLHQMKGIYGDWIDDLTAAQKSPVKDN